MADLIANPPLGIWPNKPHHWKLRRLCHNFRSFVAFVRVYCNVRQYDIVIKKYPSNMDPSTAAKEYDLLHRSYKIFAHNDGAAVPMPIRLFSEVPAIAMSMAPGIPATRVLSRIALWPTTKRVRRGEAIVRNCVRWLRSFHLLDKSEDCKDELVERLRHSVDCRLYKLQVEPDPLVPSELAGRLANRLAEWVDAADWSQQPVATLHHDFGAHNILVEGSRVTVIDLADSTSGFAAQDCQRLLLEVDILERSRRWKIGNPFPDWKQAISDEYPMHSDHAAHCVHSLLVTLSFYLTIRQFAQQSRFFQPWHTRASAYLADRLGQFAVG